MGSAEEQTSRDFLQALTFEMVIRHANRRLQKMTDRYVLVPVVDHRLSFEVIDNWQRGEPRPVKNLSGGENFVVSLALALGLSQTASPKVRVDSLFLDEDFSTLDEESLDMALFALASLRREGQLIGVISNMSNVGALKERIPAQIEILPQENGRSVIQTPGE
jgi:exonuclease SbcC